MITRIATAIIIALLWLAERAEHEVVVEELPWSLTAYLAPLEEQLEKEDTTLYLRYKDQVVELRDIGITSHGNGALWLGETMVHIYDAHDNGLVYDDRWADVMVQDVNGDGLADLTVCCRELRTVDEHDKELAAPLPLGMKWRIFLWDAAHKGLVEAGWRFNSCAEGGEAVFPHRFEAQRAGEEPTVLWRSVKPLQLLGYVDAGEYAVAFFADPIIRPSGNIILAWRLVAGKAPELIYATPYADEDEVYYELSNLRVEGGRVLGRITARPMRGQGELPPTTIELSDHTPPIDFPPPYDAENALD